MSNIEDNPMMKKLRKKLQIKPRSLNTYWEGLEIPLAIMSDFNGQIRIETIPYQRGEEKKVGSLSRVYNEGDKLRLNFEVPDNWIYLWLTEDLRFGKDVIFHVVYTHSKTTKKINVLMVD